MTNSEQVLIINAEAGRVVVQDVADAKGNALVAAGTVLTERLIAQLQRRGIESLALQPSCSPEDQAARGQEIEQRLDNQFSQHGADPTMQRLKQLLTDYHRRDLTEAGDGYG